MAGSASCCTSGMVILLCFLASEGKSSKILFFNGLDESSHYSVAASLAEELYARGHSVTFLIGDDLKHRVENPVHSEIFNFVFVETNVGGIKHFYHEMTNAAFEGKNLYMDHNFMIGLVREEAKQCQIVFQSSTLAKLKNSTFDLVVFDATQPCCVALSEYLNVERVAIVPTALLPFLLRNMGNPVNPATTAESNLGLPRKMSFYQRIQNVVMLMLEKIATDDYIHEIYRDFLDPLGVKPYTNSLNNVNVFITAGDPLLDRTVAVMPGHIIAAGLTAVVAKPLPEELEEFMQSSGDDGVIVFSLGTFVSHLPDEFVRIFKEAFSQLPQKVIWQWKNDDSTDGMPDNVKTMAWLPQNDLLGHSKTRLLIFQAGNNGVYEAIYHAVPLLAMPLLLDQMDVAQRIVEKEIGLKIDVTKLTSQSLIENIQRILTQPKYQNNMNLLSAMFHDYPLTPRVKAAHWIEHVLKFGSDHLKSPDYEFTFIQLNLIDVYLFFTFVISLCFVGLWLSITKLAGPLLNVLRRGKLQKMFIKVPLKSLHINKTFRNHKRFIALIVCAVLLMSFTYTSSSVHF